MGAAAALDCFLFDSGFGIGAWVPDPENHLMGFRPFSVGVENLKFFIRLEVSRIRLELHEDRTRRWN